MNLEKIKLEDLIGNLNDYYGRSYILTPITPSTTLDQIANAQFFAAEEEDKEEEAEPDGGVKEMNTEKKKTGPKPGTKPPIDHGKIVALYRAGWSCAKNADEMRVSPQTVINHLTKDGIYKKKEVENDD